MGGQLEGSEDGNRELDKGRPWEIYLVERNKGPVTDLPKWPWLETTELK